MEYRLYTNLDSIEPSVIGGLLSLHGHIFSGGVDTLIPELQKKHGLCIQCALEQNQVVGYKIGYERSTGNFYSWLGGVHPDYRGAGVATELMTRQHDWCKNSAYRTIRTHTMNRWRNMLILNLRHEFHIIGTFTDDKGEPKIILEKKLT